MIIIVIVIVMIIIMIIRVRSGKSSEGRAEGARPPRWRKYISVMFGLLSQSRS